jgi:CPA2 family monovalent cation:H+ antiporter-2
MLFPESISPLFGWLLLAAGDAAHGNEQIILTLTVGLAAALALGYVTQRIGLSPIVGYLLAGVVIGKYTPGFQANENLAAELAHIGVILLMFGVGLHFHFKELLAVRKVAVPGAIGQSLVAIGLGVAAAWLLKMPLASGLVFGMAISVASTVVLLRVLADSNDLHTPIGHIAIGWSVVQDLLTVLALVLMPVIFGDKPQSPQAIATAIGLAIAKIGVLVAFVMFVGGKVIPWMLHHIALTRSRELFTLTVLVVALGIAIGAAKIFNVSMELGAFLAGMVVGRSDFSSRAASEALPMRDAFAVLFFVSVGMLFNPALVLAMPELIIATLGIVIVGKFLAALVIVLGLGYPLRVGLAVAIALAQIGEFSFILAQVGVEKGVLDENHRNALITAAIISISLNPLLYKLTDALEALAKRSPKLGRWINGRSPVLGDLHRDDVEEHTSRGSAIVVGYGPVGRTLVRLLQENDIEPTVLELNVDTVQQLRADGIRAIYGDASHKDTLITAGANQALVFILSASGLNNSQEMIRLARECNPEVRVFARAAYLREIPALTKAGADVVFTGEGEVALTMTEFIMRHLGASPDQIDRQRDRIRTELFGSMAALEILLPPVAKHVADEPAVDVKPVRTDS